MEATQHDVRLENERNVNTTQIHSNDSLETRQILNTTPRTTLSQRNTQITPSFSMKNDGYNSNRATAIFEDNRDFEGISQPISPSLSQASSSSITVVPESSITHRALQDLTNQREELGGSMCIPRSTDLHVDSSNPTSEEEDYAIERKKRKVSFVTSPPVYCQL